MCTLSLTGMCDGVIHRIEQFASESYCSHREQHAKRGGKEHDFRLGTVQLAEETLLLQVTRHRISDDTQCDQTNASDVEGGQVLQRGR